MNIPDIIMLLVKYIILGIGRANDGPIEDVYKAPSFEYSDVEVTTDDNVKLRAYLVKPKEINEDTLFFLVCHGTGCNQYSYSPICRKDVVLGGKNVCVLFADYREFGTSEGTFTVEGASHDIDAYLRYMKDTLKAKRVNLHGHSLGAAIILKYVCYVKSESREKLYDKVILLSTFTCSKHAVIGAIKNYVKDEHLAKVIYGFVGGIVENCFNYNNLKNIECADVKDVLIIHSDADEITPKEEVEELSKKSGAVLKIIKGDHNHTIGAPEAWKYIFEFVPGGDSSAFHLDIQENPPVSSGETQAREDILS